MIVRLLEIASGEWQPKNPQFAYNEEKGITDGTIENLNIVSKSLDDYSYPFVKDGQNGLNHCIYQLEVVVRAIELENYADALDGIIAIQSLLATIAALFKEKARIDLFQNDQIFQDIAQYIIDVNNQLYDELAALAGKNEAVAQALSDFHSENK